ncbi:polyphenol oxidase family protein [Actinomycetota bacterium]|nr:polyphenol oxidase family protein [Actinomycetota bacterium]
MISRADGGRSVGDFAAGNLADHVGDDEDAVQTNRRHLASALKAKEGLAFIRASHGADVAWVTTPDTFADVDALATDRNDIGLVALGADCAIIGLHGHRRDGTPVLGVAHCGWKGLVKDVIGSVVAEMTSDGAENIGAVLGPAICGECYRVDAERHDAVRAAVSDRVAHAALVTGVQQPVHSQWAPHEQKDEGFGIDIRAGSKERLMELGVAIDGEELLQGRECTYESATWFSYRRSMAQARSGRSGRQALAVVSATSHDADES